MQPMLLTTVTNIQSVDYIKLLDGEDFFHEIIKLDG